jgi:hypothetical protein
MSVSELVAQYEEAHSFARQLVSPEEDRATLTSAKWVGGYRWFRSTNVVCLEKYRAAKRSCPQPRLAPPPSLRA